MSKRSSPKRRTAKRASSQAKRRAGKAGTTRRPKDEAPEIVLAILEEVHKATKYRRPPWWTSGDAIVLPPKYAQHKDAAILAAVQMGRLGAGGDPPHSAPSPDGELLFSWNAATLPFRPDDAAAVV
jgi:hypothetical protein